MRRMARSLLVSPSGVVGRSSSNWSAKNERAITFFGGDGPLVELAFAVRLATSPRARRQVNADAGKEEAKQQTAEHGERLLCHNIALRGLGTRGLGD